MADVKCLESNWSHAEEKYGVDSEEHIEAMCQPLSWCMLEGGHKEDHCFVDIKDVIISSVRGRVVVDVVNGKVA